MAPDPPAPGPAAPPTPGGEAAAAAAEVQELEARLAEARGRLAGLTGSPVVPPALDPAAFPAWLDSFTGCVWVKDGEGVFLYANPAMHDRFAVERSGLIGRRTEQLGLPPAELAELLEHDRRVAQTREPFEGVERVTLPDGQQRVWSVVKFPLPTGASGRRLTGGMAVELPETRAQDERLALALDAGGGGTWQWDANGGEPSVRLSPGCYRMLGLEPEPGPVDAGPWRERVHPDDAEAFAAGRAAVLSGEEPELHVDGSWRWVRSLGRPIRRGPGGRPQRVVGLHLDVHAQKLAEELLRDRNRELQREVREGEELLEESEARFAGLVGDAQVMLWGTRGTGGDDPEDAPGLWMNPAMERFLGPEARPGGRVRADLERWLAEPAAGKVEGAKAPGLPGDPGLPRDSGLPGVPGVPGGDTLEREVRVTDASGQTRWLLLSGRPRRTRTGRFLGHAGTAVDVTDRHRSRVRLEMANAGLEAEVQERTKELRERVAELAARNRELDQFAHVASHDLRSPLRTIIGFSDFLGPAVAGDPEAEGYLQRIQRAGGRMAALLDALLKFTSVGRGRITPGPVELGEVVAHALEDLTAEALRRGADVQVGPLPRVRGDGVLLRQVFQNLLGNALKYSGDRPPRVRVTADDAFREGGRCRVTVADAGVGFDPEVVPRLFEPFARFHREEAPGSGVGLSIVRRVVERHGGRVHAEARPGEEFPTRFHVELPTIEA